MNKPTSTRLFQRAASPAHVFGNPRPLRPVATPPEQFARGTREIPPYAAHPGSALYEHNLGKEWFYSLRCEQLGRNLAVAGALEMAYRLGLSHDAFERAGRRR